LRKIQKRSLENDQQLITNLVTSYFFQITWDYILLMMIL
jgi:hypothetical protein